MSQSISLWGATYSNVPAVELPKQGGGTAQFDDTSDADATASDIASGKTAYVNGTKITGTGSGGGDAPIWQGADDYVYVSDTAAAPVEIYTDGDYVVLDMAPAPLNLQTKSVSPTESAQSVTADVGYDALGQVNVGAISSSYVGSGVARKSSSDLTASGATVTAPAGYYESNATKTVASGSATPASTISGTSATVSTGTNTLTLSKTVSNTPQVSAGYISSGTTGNSSVSLTASVTTKAAATYTPSTSTQTISSDQYLTGAQTISAIPQGVYDIDIANAEFYTDSGVRKWRARADMDVWDGWLPSNSYYGPYKVKNAVASGTSVTPSSSSQTIGGADYMMEGAVTVNPIPSQYIVPTGTKSITANGTGIDVTSYASVDVNVSGGGGGLEYEEGVYIPTANTSSATINFLDNHTTAPYQVFMVDTTGTTASTSSNLTWCITNWNAVYPNTSVTDGAETKYAYVFTHYLSGSTIQATSYNINSLTGDSSTSDMEYWITSEWFKPYSGNTRYWRKDRTYKWIAVWAPTT